MGVLPECPGKDYLILKLMRVMAWAVENILAT